MTDARTLAEHSLFDAHCHADDPRLVPSMDHPQMSAVRAMVVNGTHPEDWPRIQQFSATGETSAMKAYGVHPWKVNDLPADWDRQLISILRKGAVSVGEIGLDYWIEPRDAEKQRTVFLRQLELCRELHLPPSIHCVRAWGALLDCLHRGPPLPQGFLLHGYSGSVEFLHQLVELGGYFSFSAYGAHPGRKKIREAARACPLDRLLIETDAPDMVPPEDVCRFPLKDEDGNRLHHPAELATAYVEVASWRKMDPEELVARVGQNFRKLFGLPQSF